MSGIAIQVLRRQQIDLPAVTQPYTMNPLAQFIDTLGWVSGVLQVRIYEKAITGANTVVQVIAYNTMVAEDDPSVTFYETANPVGEISIATGTSSDPTLASIALPEAGAALGRFLSVLVKVLPNGSTPGGTVTIGVDVIGRDA